MTMMVADDDDPPRFTKVYHHYDRYEYANVSLDYSTTSPNTTLTTIGEDLPLPVHETSSTVESPPTCLDQQPTSVSITVTTASDTPQDKSQEELPPAPVLTPSPSTLSTPQLDVKVRIGKDIIGWQSSAILQLASPVLSRHLKAIDGGGGWELDLRHRSLSEWTLLEPFLQPHASQAAVLTPENLPTLLKWIHELQLHVLLQEADAILKSCMAQWQFSSAEDVADLVVLARIAARCRLSLSCGKVWAAWNQVLLQSPSSLAGDLRLLQSFCQLLHEHASTREALWRSLIRFLPDDLEVFSNPSKLVQNPLFVYLLREGLWKEDRRIREEQQAEDDEAELPTTALPSSTTTTPTFSLGAQSWPISFQEWWNRWSPVEEEEEEPKERPKTTLAEHCPVVSPSSAVCPPPPPPPKTVSASAYATRACLLSPDDMLPKHRGEWLNSIWQQLESEPILQPMEKQQQHRQLLDRLSVAEKSPPRPRRVSPPTRPRSPKWRSKTVRQLVSSDSEPSEVMVVREQRKFLC